MLTPGMLSEVDRAHVEALRADGAARPQRARSRRPRRLRLALGTRMVSAGLRLIGEGR